MSNPTLDEVQDAILTELYADKPAHRTLMEDIALKRRLLAIMHDEAKDPVALSRLFREVMEGD
jgi:hypothetical protein